MTAYQVPNRARPGELLKRPAKPRRALKLGRSPREENSKHLEAIRDLPCIKCGLEGFSEAAHVRMSSAAFNKRSGIGEKPDDKWTLPLCAGCHRLDPDSQHKVGELTFWANVGLNPLLVCEKLHQHSPNLTIMRAVLFDFIARRRALNTDNRGNARQ